MRRGRVRPGAARGLWTGSLTFRTARTHGQHVLPKAAARLENLAPSALSVALCSIAVQCGPGEDELAASLNTNSGASLVQASRVRGQGFAGSLIELGRREVHVRAAEVHEFFARKSGGT